jgi:hypothetical protein
MRSIETSEATQPATRLHTPQRLNFRTFHSEDGGFGKHLPDYMASRPNFNVHCREDDRPHESGKVRIITYLLTRSVQQSPSWEAIRFAASQVIPRILGNPKVHYRIHKCPPPDPIKLRIVSQIWRVCFAIASRQSISGCQRLNVSL